MTEAELENVAERLEKTPSLTRQLVSNLSDEVLRWKRTARDFSILENVCHLRDIEREGYSVRIRKLLDEQQPFLPDIDGELLARERKYNSQPLAKALDEFATERLANVSVIRTLHLDQLTRVGLLETVGSISLERLLAMMQDHDREHLQLIQGARDALSSP